MGRQEGRKQQGQKIGKGTPQKWMTQRIVKPRGIETGPIAAY